MAALLFAPRANGIIIVPILRNTAPTITSIAGQTIDEDKTAGPVSFTVNDGETPTTLTVSAASTDNTTLVPAGAISIGGTGTARTITITPALNQSGSATILVTVTDAGGLTASSRFTLTVNPVNDPPTVSGIRTQTIDEDTSTGAISFVIGDIDSSAASLTVTAAAADKTLVPDSGISLGVGATSPYSRTITVTPAANQSGQTSITVTVSDGLASTSTSFGLIVNPINDPPTIGSIGSRTINEDAAAGPIDFTIGDLETPADLLNVSASADNTTLVPAGAISLGGKGTARTIAITPAANQSGNATILVTVTDAGGLTASSRFILTVNPVNDPPTVSSIGTQVIDEDSSTGPLSFVIGDIDSPLTTLTVSAAAADKTLVPDSGIVIGTPPAGAAPSSRTITVTPAANQSGQTSITITVSDGQASASTSFGLVVNPVNDPPAINRLASLAIDEDAGTQTVSLSGISAGPGNESQTLTISATSSDTSLIPNPTVNYTSPNSTGTLTFAPVANANGKTSITVTVNDGGSVNNTASATFSVVVNPVDDPPTLGAVADVTINEDAVAQSVSLSGITSGASNESQTLTVSASSDNTGLIPNPAVSYTSPNATGSLSFTPVGNANGSANITVSVSDGGQNAPATRTFKVTVNPVNDPPTIDRIANVTINEDAGTQTVNLSGISSGASNESQTLSVSATSNNTGLIPNPTVNYTSPGATGSLTFAPVANANGSAVITVTVNDGGSANNTASVTFTVTVNPVDDPPTLGAIADVTINEDAGAQAVSLSGISSGASNESQTLTVSASSDNTGLIPNPAVSYTSPSATGSLSFTPVGNANGSANITVSVSDGGQNAPATRTFKVTVNPVNDPPTLDPIANLTINEDAGLQTVGLTGIGTGAPNESQTLSVSVSSGTPGLIPAPAVSYTSPNATGSISFLPVANGNGSAILTVTISDGGSPNGSVSRQLTVTVNPLNDPPTISDIPNQAVDQDATLGPISFAVDDIDTPLSTLTVSGKSSNPTLVPDASISLGGSAGSRTLSIKPASGQSGQTTITVTVSDGSASASDSFVLTVNKKGSPPSIITPPASQSVDEGTDVSFKVDAAGDPTLSYQWRFNQTPIRGQTGPSLLLPAVQPVQAGQYDVVVTNPFGSTTSSGATLTVNVVELDFGDAPDPTFPTMLKNNGARVRILKGFSLGKLIDSEKDGQPSVDASGDGADDDGLLSITPLVPGQTTTLHLLLSDPFGLPGRLDAWIDFNANGSWADAGEKVFDRQLLVPGDNTLAFAVPAGAKPGDVFARFRLSREGGYSFDGANSDGGEIEDYRLRIDQPVVEEYDFGDAPDPTFPTTLKNNGARHRIVKGVFLGALIDAETDGKPSADALGDDGASPTVPDDEDGVKFLTPLTPGQTAKIEVTASISGRLDAWIDFNGSGSWVETPERIFSGQTLISGVNSLAFNVPADAKVGEVFARFRFSRDGVKNFDGAAPDGEVEDYKVPITAPAVLDFGDAPQIQSDLAGVGGGYPTTLVRNGARHVIDPKFVLGKLIDAEPDGQPSLDALGDDGTSTTVPDDEDGVVFSSPLAAGGTATIVVTASQSGRLDAWVDFNANFSWADAGEKIFSSQTLAAGANTLTFAVPADAKVGSTFARFRFSREGGLSFDGPAPIGEVEDYKVSIDAQLLDFGDAPQLQSDLLAGGYPTTLSRNGARHGINPKFFLGKLIDGEKDGQPSPDALGDDGPDPAEDDEDGVRFLTKLIPGVEASIEVIASTTGRLDAWMDYDANSSWADAGEKIFNSQPLVPGPNVLKFLVPLRAKPGVTFSRFRFSREGGLDFIGASPIGEVEDYRVEVERGDTCDLTCAGTDFWLTFPGNYAPDPSNPVKPVLSILGNPGTAVSVVIPGLKFQQSTTIPASMCAEIVLPKSADLGDANDLIEKKGIHITATQPVSVHGLSKVKYTSDGFLAIQTDALGSDYIVQSYSNSNTQQPNLNGTQFALVATEDNTTVTIIPSVVTQGYDSGFPYVIKLQQGETYQLRNVNGPPQDLTGTIISADKPIAAFGSHRCANIQSTTRSFCDYLVEQLIPIKRWGTDYFTFPLKTRTKGDTIRILSAFDGTQIFANGIPIGTLDRGKTFQFGIGFGIRITATQPIHVTQYANSSDYDLVKQSDPFMMQLPHRALFSTQYKFCTPDGFASHFVNVIAPSATAAAGQVLMDGAPVPPGLFSAIGASGYSGASVAVAPGTHSLVSPLAVGLTQYGWADYESYGWPVCFFFGDTTPPVVKCPDPITVDLTKTVSSTGVVPCKAPVPDLREKVTFTDNCPRSPNTAGTVVAVPVAQDPAPGTLLGPGVHDIVLSVTDANGNVGSCITQFTVIGPPPDPNAQPVAHCPQDIVVACVNESGAFVDFKPYVSLGCEEFPMESNPPPGLFPVGKTQVTCVYNGLGKPVTCTFNVTVTCLTVTPVPGPGVIVKPAGTGSGMTISWPASATLQVSDSLLGPWVDIPAGANTMDVNTREGTQKFYRMKQ